MTWPDPTSLPWLVPAAVVLSALTLIAATLGLPAVLARLPADWFLNPHPLWDRDSRRWRRRATRLGRNALGWLLILIGIAMLFLPGQGLLTVLAGVVLAEVPGKMRVALWLLRRPGVRHAVDWLRKRSGSAPLRLPGDDPDTGLEGAVEEDG